MSNQTYSPDKVWQWKEGNGGKFANINRPTSGSRFEQPLPQGEHSLQLYSLATPNGIKVTILLEELIEAGISEANYDAYTIDIMEGEQFSSGFTQANPNSKIPALIDLSQNPPLRVFESGSILLYLADKFATFLPKDTMTKTECLNWLFWQMGSAPILGGGFGHFYAYAPEKFEYPIDRYTMEVKRQLDVLNNHLANNKFMCGDTYTIADMAIWPWYGQLVEGRLYDAAEFLGVNEYTNVLRWSRDISARPAVKRGCIVNKTWGEPHEQLHQRHHSSDFELKTQDKLITE
ncbi:glutathione-dependent disulfide-bond oxidoreductase [Pseudoalteromonas luteoviolacea]|uniref:Glutathione-dependent disulfide-bond oxidoreductase n=1 Tax=Pseudoalteromonas luteoviolacea TaxID=43657 RepID=A0A1C0TNM8_9GAMM|nr:glutathione-dependent disulfide-bond oxidoreductase [Pseudoalteromonas luteoviolacea]OCQ20466.1 glutathione-dependent disulfide-bond oxidoreductase [Pseudoalteromonas luteoviolacea]